MFTGDVEESIIHALRNSSVQYCKRFFEFIPDEPSTNDRFLYNIWAFYQVAATKVIEVLMRLSNSRKVLKNRSRLLTVFSDIEGDGSLSVFAKGRFLVLGTFTSAYCEKMVANKPSNCQGYPRRSKSSGIFHV